MRIFCAEHTRKQFKTSNNNDNLYQILRYGCKMFGNEIKFSQIIFCYKMLRIRIASLRPMV